jgi:hypothetical protein
VGFSGFSIVRVFIGTVEGMVALGANTPAEGYESMDMSVIELVLRHAVQRGVLDEDDVNAAVDRMWGAVATLKEAENSLRQRLRRRKAKWRRS